MKLHQSFVRAALSKGIVAVVLLASCSVSVDGGGEAAPSPSGDDDVPEDGGHTPRDARAAFSDARADQGDASFATCASLTARAERVPLELVVALDSSGSMADVIAAGTTKWAAVTRALAAVFADARSIGISVSLQFFPIPVGGVPATCTVGAQCGAYGPCTRRACLAPGPMTYCDVDDDCVGGPCIDLGTCADGSALCVPGGGGCASGASCELVTVGECLNADSCDVSRYAAQTIPATSLPGGAPALAAAMAGRALRGETPTGPALSGAIALALARKKVGRGGEAAVLMVTDGLPTRCAPQATSGLATVAAGGLASSVPTFVLGVFAPSDAAAAHATLDAIANAGGTGVATVVGTTPTVGADLVTALDGLRTAALGCAYDIPPPDAGALDPDKVNVTISAHGHARTAHRVARARDCDAGDAWYYEDRADGELRVALCPGTCTAVGADAAAEVGVVLGCATVLK